MRTGIIGGGASGMMAALAAAEQGAQVTILERRDRVGRKLLATGNGRCNLGNLDFDPLRDYRSHDRERLPGFFSRFGTEQMLAFCRERGLYVTEKNGYLYPYSGQASTVLDFFRAELARAGAELVCDCRIDRIVRRGGGYEVFAGEEKYRFDTLVLAGGSPAGTPPREALGGYGLARSLGLFGYEMLPALTALRCRERFFKSLAGVRCPAAVTLLAEGKELCCEAGELQLTDYGISGIPVFQLSRYASEALERGKRVSALLDFFPGMGTAEWQSFCRSQYEACLGKTVSFLAEGMLHKKLAALFLAENGWKPQDKVSEAEKKRIFALLGRMRRLPVQVCSVNPVENAQVCMGGIALSEMTDELEARRLPGLYLCGELLDVDGRCGGYNLQWAWTSGRIAGTAAGHCRRDRARADRDDVPAVRPQKRGGRR